jgi:predicted MFS family arabinose efflux permease
LHLSEGTAGQAIAVSGVFAVATSLGVARIAARLDRRHLLLGLVALMGLSGGVVACAGDFTVLMAGRAMLGVVIGGFWSMSAATVMRLVPPADVPRACRAERRQRAGHDGRGAAGQFPGPVYRLARGVPAGRAARGGDLCMDVAQPAHARPAAGQRTQRGVAGVDAPQGGLGPVGRGCCSWGNLPPSPIFGRSWSRQPPCRSPRFAMLLGLGLAGLVGNALVGRAVAASLRGALLAMPVAMALIALGLVAWGRVPLATGGCSLWGAIGTAAPVAWWTWLARALPDDAEAGGGLMVAVIQLAITLGAALGGGLFDRWGYPAAFAAAAALLVASGVLGWASVPRAPAERK